MYTKQERYPKTIIYTIAVTSKNKKKNHFHDKIDINQPILVKYSGYIQMNNI